MKQYSEAILNLLKFGTLSSILFCLLFPYTTVSQCVNATCLTKVKTTSTYCLKQYDGTATSGGNVQLIYDQCDSTSRYYCDPDVDDTTERYIGTCAKNTSQFEAFPTYIQFPGELCDENRAYFECGFGYRKCLAKRCYGYLAGENCVNSADCNPHLYCDSTSKTCKIAKAADETCTSNDQCDMAYMCKFESNLATQGRCKKYFSLASGSPVYAKQQSDLFVCADGFGYLDIAVTGVIDVRTFQEGLYRCSKEITSKNAGIECTSYTNCPTNVNGVYAQCGCTYSSFSKRCDILQSNTEYQEYLSAVTLFANYDALQAKEFQAATEHCHNSRILESGPCDKLNEYRNMMCKKMRAYYYLPNYNVDSCLLSHSNQYLFSEIDETQLWCSPDRSTQLLGLNNSRVMSALSQAFMIVAILYFTIL